jgi:hypothetical protein
MILLLGLNGWCHGAGSKNPMNTAIVKIPALPRRSSVARPSETRAVDEGPLLDLIENKICAKRLDRPIIDTIN